MGLTAKQEAFVNEYLIDKNATQAALRAGFSKKSAGELGHRMLKKVEVQKAIKAKLVFAASQANITAERVIKRIAEIAFDSEYAKKTDILKACELLGKKFKLFTDVVEHAGKDGAPLVILTMPSNGREAPAEEDPSGTPNG